MRDKYEVIIQTNLKDRPSDHELSAALILANYFKSNVIFLRPQADRTPDIDINGIKWEIKSPLGNSKRTIENNFRTARKQSLNLILDLRRIKMHSRQARDRIKFFLSKSHHFKKVLIITKNKQVIEFYQST